MSPPVDNPSESDYYPIQTSKINSSRNNRCRRGCSEFGRFRVARLFAGSHHDFYQQARIGQIGLHARTRRRGAGRQPRGPDFVHCLAVTDVLDPDLGLQQAALVSAVRLQDLVDLGKNSVVWPLMSLPLSRAVHPCR